MTTTALPSQRRKTSKSKAKQIMMPSRPLPSTSKHATGDQSNFDTQETGVPVAVIHKSAGKDALPTTMAPAIPPTAAPTAVHIDPDFINDLREFYAHRVATIKMQRRINNQCRSLVRRTLGWSLNLPEAERTKINKVAAKIVEFNQEGGTIDPEHKKIAEQYVMFCAASKSSREHFDEYRKHCERSMEAAAKKLPVFPWVEATPGVGVLGLAIIVGEAGDLSNYSNPAKLWMRMGLAVIGGKSQRKSTNVEEAARQGYNPRRRSAMWTLGDSMLKAKGPYRELFLTRLKYEVEKAGPDHKSIKYLGVKTNKKGIDYDSYSLHARRRAQRYVEKRLLRNLWRAWRATDKPLQLSVE